jgi:hypothetical protein
MEDRLIDPCRDSFDAIERLREGSTPGGYCRASYLEPIMRLPIAAFAAVSAVLVLAASPAEARRFRFGGGVHAGSYTRPSGAPVQPHARSAPDGTRASNWTVVGVPPYAAKRGVQPVTGASQLVSAGGVGPVAEGGEVPPALAAAAPAEWCPTKAVAGSGAGFCLIN